MPRTVPHRCGDEEVREDKELWDAAVRLSGLLKSRGRFAASEKILMVILLGDFYAYSTTTDGRTTKNEASH